MIRGSHDHLVFIIRDANNHVSCPLAKPCIRVERTVARDGIAIDIGNLEAIVIKTRHQPNPIRSTVSSNIADPNQVSGFKAMGDRADYDRVRICCVLNEATRQFTLEVERHQATSKTVRVYLRDVPGSTTVIVAVAKPWVRIDVG